VSGDGTFPITNIVQIALVVKDLDETVRHWSDRFGVGPWSFYTYGPPLVPRMTRHGQPTEYTMRIALANVGPMRIELIEPVEGDTVYAEFVRDHGFGVHHLGVLVENMDEALGRARDAGLAMTQDGAGFGPDGDGHYAYLDTEPLMGTTIELIERPKRRAAPDRIYPPAADPAAE
jgi:catechol 2,3-dioxygenase-like lactoylglutathione lyase family enzyme